MGKIKIGRVDEEMQQALEFTEPFVQDEWVEPSIEQESFIKETVTVIKEVPTVIKEEIHHHHKEEFDAAPLFEKLEQDKQDIVKQLDAVQHLIRSDAFIKIESLTAQIEILKERQSEARALIQDLDVKLQKHEERIHEVEQRKVTDIIRIKPETPKGLYYLAIFTFIIALTGLFT